MMRKCQVKQDIWLKMSAASRGCLLRHQNAFKMPPPIRHLFFQRNSFQHCQFSSTSIFQAVKASNASVSKVLPKNKPSFTPISSSGAAHKAYQSYAEQLSLKSHPTVLYQAPSHGGYMTASYVAALVAFGWSGVLYWIGTVDPPEDVSHWVPKVFVFMAGIGVFAGGWLVVGPRSIVRSITAIPRTMAIATKGQVSSELQVEIELKKMFPLPFFPARRIYASPSDLTLATPLAQLGTRPLSNAEIQRVKEVRVLERKRQVEYNRANLLTHPFKNMARGLSKALFAFFAGTKRVIHKDGFTKFGVKGSDYKLDVTGGWVLDGGRAIDRLIKQKPGL